MYLRIAALGVVCLFVAVCIVSYSHSQHSLGPYIVVASGDDPIPINIDSTVPNELNASGGGAPKATMQQAAAFAWQEFIALNWPAVAQTGAENTRDMPNNNCSFGDSSCSGPLVWQTFRGKVEIFPGSGNPPGYPGVAPNDPSLGYDAHPQYNYAFPVGPCDSSPSGVVVPTAWINLDETDQITLDSMFAGIAPTTVKGNSEPQLIRFLAKGNRVEYAYVAKNQWWSSIPSKIRTATMNYLNQNQASPPQGSNIYVSLPDGTIEVKAGWRELTQKEINSHHFTTASARFYETVNNNTCWRQHTLGLVALHIIQKTPTAPYFIYATFEQTDNILTAGGQDVEDEYGNVIQPPPPCRADQTAPCPTTPSVTLEDTPVVSMTGVPPQVNLVPAGAQYCTAATTS